MSLCDARALVSAIQSSLPLDGGKLRPREGRRGFYGRRGPPPPSVSALPPPQPTSSSHPTDVLHLEASCPAAEVAAAKAA